jgi:hypothetical protein
MNFLDIKKVLFHIRELTLAYEHLRKAGRKGLEAVVLFAGTYDETISSFRICETIVPLQMSLNIEGGLLYAVDGEELHRINVHLHESRQLLIAQMHTHPGRAYHSSTDDAYPIVTKIGALSIVVPNFAMDDLAPQRWAVYRLSESILWEKLSAKDVNNLIQVVG